MADKFNLAVLGGGPGGYVAAIRASQLGFSTTVIEMDNMGGVCLNWGCIPTKSLLKNAEIIETIRDHSGDFGITVKDFEFDFNKIIKRSRKVSTKVSKGVDYLMRKNNIEVKKGFGKLTSKNRIDIFDEKKQLKESITADNIILATGARPKKIDSIPVDNVNIITSSQAMSLSELPKEMIIIGAGLSE